MIDVPTGSEPTKSTMPVYCALFHYKISGTFSLLRVQFPGARQVGRVDELGAFFSHELAKQAIPVFKFLTFVPGLEHGDMLRQATGVAIELGHSVHNAARLL